MSRTCRSNPDEDVGWQAVLEEPRNTVSCGLVVKPPWLRALTSHTSSSIHDIPVYFATCADAIPRPSPPHSPARSSRIPSRPVSLDGLFTGL